MTSAVIERLRRLNAIGTDLSAEKDNSRLLERILQSARELTNADGGTLYLAAPEKTLRFEIVLTESLGLHLGGTSGEPVPFYPIRLYDAAGNPNHNMVAAYAALAGVTVNIPDAYEAEEFDFSGTRAFDLKTGYRSKSFLTVPMRDHENHITGVLQLINARAPETHDVVPFSTEDQELVESLSSQAAVTLSNKRLIDDQRKLFESFVKLIAGAIDDKSPHTGGHCRRVPELTMMLADAAASDDGPLRDFAMDGEQRYALTIAAWLHDCGKITTPEYVVEKSTKLETIYDRMHMVDTRFEVLRREAEIRLLKGELAALKDEAGQSAETLRREYEDECQRLDEDLAFLHRCNIGGEAMSAADQEQVRTIGRRRWKGIRGDDEDLLSDDEIYNLTVARGTLTPEEREIINYHIVASIKMLEALPYPEYLKAVPEYAAGHHERMDGRGYPRGLTREQMSVQARVMGIADIFEALTAKDRPYKEGMKLSQALQIMGRMKLDNHIDPDLFDVFVRKRVYLQYAQTFLDPEQMDEVDENCIPGYSPMPRPKFA
ncbi:MAG: HD domain-containing phosphohydrolase [Gammaproteobacteria bacterium]|nr:HD domain-containing phosphohydrolase [Gammaproteobacteria bacterium]